MVHQVDGLSSSDSDSDSSKAYLKIPSLCAVSVRAAVLGHVVDEEAGGVVERTALGWILASQKKGFPGVVRN